jgi:hypothetical protein
MPNKIKNPITMNPKPNMINPLLVHQRFLSNQAIFQNMSAKNQEK